jgi:hypothetical protein
MRSCSNRGKGNRALAPTSHLPAVDHLGNTKIDRDQGKEAPPTDHFCRKFSTSSWQPAKRRNNLRCKCDGISRLGVGTCHSDQRLG